MLLLFFRLQSFAMFSYLRFFCSFLLLLLLFWKLLRLCNYLTLSLFLLPVFLFCFLARSWIQMDILSGFPYFYYSKCCLFLFVCFYYFLKILLMHLLVIALFLHSLSHSIILFVLLNLDLNILVLLSLEVLCRLWLFHTFLLKVLYMFYKILLPLCIFLFLIWFYKWHNTLLFPLLQVCMFHLLLLFGRRQSFRHIFRLL